MSVWARLRDDAAALVAAEPALAQGLTETALAEDPAVGIAALLGRLLPRVWIDPGAVAREVLTADDVAAVLADLDRIVALDFQPGGLAAAWLGARGFHMLTAHRVSHRLWTGGRRDLAVAFKAAAATLGADIHPAARIGRGIFLDHGIGVVIGETAVVEDEACIWHGVTLGSTLMEQGDRHPKVRRGAVLGAGATVLGNIEIGELAVVAAGSVVLASVPARTTVAGNPAVPRGRWRHPYAT